MNKTSGSEIYIGLMSGTSLDGVDVAIVDFSLSPPRILHCQSTPYPEPIRRALKTLCHSQSISLNALYSLDAELGEIYAASVNSALGSAAIDQAAIVAVGCHGQTIRHSPDATIPFTAQIGDPNRLAALCGITTVADFRRKDIAFGGQAAPLAPAFHQFLFQSEAEDRVVVNIGGIANITSLPATLDSPVIGFDTGPGNTLLDYWMEKHQSLPYDDAGAWARGGHVIEGMLQAMIAGEKYFRAETPKSTGTEYFSPDWLHRFVNREHDARDVQATLVELTACTIASAISELAVTPANCFVCGGGAHNRYLLERLQQRLSFCNVQTTDVLGINPDYVEAAAFAWLARERIELRGGNMPAVTHARRTTILGGVYRAE